MRQTNDDLIQEALDCLPEADEFHGKVMQAVFPVPFLRAVFEDIGEIQREADAKVAALESLRPIWAKGYSSDSVAAQGNGAALSQIWAALKVDNQTSAMEAIRALLAYGAHGAPKVTKLEKALEPLVEIANAFDRNELDDEARKWHGPNGEGAIYSTTPPYNIEIVQGRGGKRLLTLQQCLDAREAIHK